MVSNEMQMSKNSIFWLHNSLSAMADLAARSFMKSFRSLMCSLVSWQEPRTMRLQAPAPSPAGVGCLAAVQARNGLSRLKS